MLPVAVFVPTYKAGLLPLYLEHGAGGVRIHWTTPPDQLNPRDVLPMFFDGLRVAETVSGVVVWLLQWLPITPP
jgi:hypothetical protein